MNVSAKQFRRNDLVRTVTEALAATGLEPRWLELELTESLMMLDVDHVIATLEALRELGVQIAVDDFGTGYSSLSYLRRFPVSRLKVDRSFVQDIGNASDGATIARAIIALGHNLGLKVVAEGVETEEQIAFLAANRCDELQGFYFARPLLPEQLAALLSPGGVAASGGWSEGRSATT